MVAFVEGANAATILWFIFWVVIWLLIFLLVLRWGRRQKKRDKTRRAVTDGSSANASLVDPDSRMHHAEGGGRRA